MHIKEIEKRIIEIKKEIAGKPKELKAPIAQVLLDGQIRNAIKPLQEELAILEIKRQFILDKRDSLFSRVIWNIVVPIIVSSVTAFLVSKIIK